MTNWEVLLIAVGLAMDAFAVAVTDGLCCRKLQLPQVLAISLTFGSLQGLMPLLGFLLGSRFAGIITAMDHFVALIILGLIGCNMFWEGLHSNVDADAPFSLTFGKLLGQGVGTSIDALAVGVGFAAMPNVPIRSAIAVIVLVTACLSAIGCWLGRRCGSLIGKQAQLLGGCLLLAMGVRIFLQHMLS